MVDSFLSTRPRSNKSFSSRAACSRDSTLIAFLTEIVSLGPSLSSFMMRVSFSLSGDSSRITGVTRGVTACNVVLRDSITGPSSPGGNSNFSAAGCETGGPELGRSSGDEDTTRVWRTSIRASKSTNRSSCFLSLRSRASHRSLPKSLDAVSLCDTWRYLRRRPTEMATKKAEDARRANVT